MAFSYSDLRAFIESIPIEDREAIVSVIVGLLISPATYVLLVFVARRLNRNSSLTARKPSKTTRLGLTRAERNALQDETNDRDPE